MITAARTASQIGTHAAIAFGLMYGMTGSLAFGGLAAILEPVINVLLLPLHERAWAAIRKRDTVSQSALLATAAQKLSQTGLHMAVGFLVIYMATGSLVTSWLMAILEPVCNVIVLPLHDALWARIRSRVAGMTTRGWVVA